MKDLDKLFESELQKNEIAYSEEYWKDMELLLDKKDKKILFMRRVKFISFLIVFLISMVCLFYVPFISKTKLIGYKIEKRSSKEFELNKVKLPIVTNQNDAFDETKGKSIPNDLKRKSIKNGNLNKSFLLLNNEELLKEANSKSSMLSNVLSFEKNSNYDSAILIENSLNCIGFNRFYNEFIKEDSIFEKIKPVNPPRKQKWEHFLSPMFAFDQSIMSRNNDDVILVKRDNEIYLSSKSFHLNYSIKKNKLAFGIGLAVMSHQFKTNYWSEFNELIFDTTLRLINPNFSQTSKGTKIALLYEDVDTLVYKRYQVLNPNNKAVFNYLQIPLYVRYDINLNRLGVFAETGLNTRILYRARGGFLSKQGQEFREIDLGHSKDYNNYLFSCQLSIGVKSRISRKVNFLAMYTYHQSLNSIVSSYTQRVNQSSLKLGLEFKLY